MSRAWILAALFFSFPAHAAVNGLPFDPSLYSNPSALISPALANSLVKMVGTLSDEKSYEPASALGTSAGVDISIEATLFKVSKDFLDALSSAGVNTGAAIPFVPIAKLHIHKGLSDRVDIGVSGIFFEGYSIWGSEIKIVTYQPEEGPVWAIRMSYSRGNLGFVSTTTYTPAVLLSQPLDYMEPYVGLAYEIIQGDINITVPAQQIAGQTIVIPALTASGSASAAIAFMGLGFRIPHSGLKLTIEGSYNTGGADALGIKFGFNF